MCSLSLSARSLNEIIAQSIKEIGEKKLLESVALKRQFFYFYPHLTNEFRYPNASIDVHVN